MEKENDCSDGDAEFDTDSNPKYRYLLWRILEPTNDKRIVFIMLNPSKAGKLHDSDRTLEACKEFARHESCGRLTIVNLFPYIETNSKKLEKCKPDELLGDKNRANKKIIEAIDGAYKITLAWGKKAYTLKEGKTRVDEVLNILDGKELWCVDITKSGIPCHPLYKKRDNLKPWPKREK